MIKFLCSSSLSVTISETHYLSFFVLPIHCGVEVVGSSPLRKPHFVTVGFVALSIILACIIVKSKSDTWLTTGDGEMYSATTDDDFFSEVIGEIITLENKLINEIIIRLAKLDDDYLKMLHQLVDSMHEKQLKK
ncbi:hypothetical protein [Lysinibacillus fusiformis]|uniref:hypothetical protein n=1 Tax=Lysinibacillus fusiformis TaxID=28031 RepID=UPI0035582ACF